MEIKPLVIKGLEPNKPLVIAGPCSAESREQVLETAKQLARAGVKVFRAGVWKPRTKPGGFEGMGAEALGWLREVRELTGMKIATEVATPLHVLECLKAGVDILWIGARTVANPFAMQELANSLRGLDIPVLVKNPVNPDIELWIGGLERIYNAGIHNIGVIHRGFSSSEKSLYRNDPVWQIPIELKRRYPELTIICDPSHMGGRRELVAPLCQQALDLDFDGFIVEAHCNPDCALSDAKQQLTPEVLDYTLKMLVIKDNKQTTENIAALRTQIDHLDEKLLTTLAARMRVSREIGRYKKEHNMPVLQSSRYSEVLEKRAKDGAALGLSKAFVEEIMRSIHEESVNIQLETVKE